MIFSERCEIMKNKKYIAIAACAAVLLVILVALICVVIGMRDPATNNSTTGSTGVHNTTGTAQGTETPPTTVEASDPTEEPPATTVQPTAPATDPATDPTEKPTEPATEPPTEPTETVPSGLQFPYLIPGTELVLETINPYTGVFLEDGSDAEVQNIYTVVIHNRSSDCAEYIDLTITREDGKKLSFTASAIESGSTVVIMEASAATYEKMGYSDCTARVAPLKHMEMSENAIEIKEDANGSLVVTNISGVDIPCLRIFYKFYMPDVNVYVGGITYTAKVLDLGKGETKVVMPSHYAKDNSKIVMVKIYETAD